LDLKSSNSGCARLGSGVAPLLGVVIEEVAVLIVLVRRQHRAVGAAVRRAVDDEVPGAVEEEAGPAARSSVFGLSLSGVPRTLAGQLAARLGVRCATHTARTRPADETDANNKRGWVIHEQNVR